ncbi:hypothetical protein [Tenacibaculum amylolyticum]|uniref:hypothetical protein n=1 Tax=Tenacibaculum amylolyticum TaxID=104269 RepID=UPI0038B4B88C
MIRILSLSNRLLLIATISLYATIIFGLYAQVLLGGYQVLAALLLIFLWKNYGKKEKNMLIIYWGITLVYGILSIIGNFSMNGFWGILFWIIIPISIAVYFTYVLEIIKKSYGNIK